MIALPLEDIVLPPAPGFWPPAPGWWLLAFLVIVLLTLTLIGLWRHWRYRLRLQQAERLLVQQCRHLQGSELCRSINIWLKLCARDRYPHAMNLHGEAWITFLNNSAGQPLFTDQPARALAQGIYQPAIDANADVLCRLARQWLHASRALQRGSP